MTSRIIQSRACWRRSRGIAGGLLLSVAAIILAVSGGCQTTVVERSDGRPLPPSPRAGVTPPPATPVTDIVLMAGAKPRDTNNNMFPDLIECWVYLFADPYPNPKIAEGEFIFTLHRSGEKGQPDAKPIAQWRITGERLRRAITAGSIGPGYRFQLSLLEDGGTDVYPAAVADLEAKFLPADDSPIVRSQGVRTIQIGRQMTAAELAQWRRESGQ